MISLPKYTYHVLFIINLVIFLTEITQMAKWPEAALMGLMFSGAGMLLCGISISLK